jgi:protein phosphatase
MTSEEQEIHDTQEVERSTVAPDLTHFSVSSSLTEIDMAGITHPGFVRANNEDHYVAVRMHRSLDTLLTNLSGVVVPERFDETAYGMVVADGMGGMAAGEVASSVALLRLLELVLQTPDWVMKMNERENAVTVMRRMTNRFRQIDDELREQGEKYKTLHGMGTTLTAAASLGTDLFVGHIGDSRAYLLRGEKLHQLTKDHTLAQALVEAGIAGAEDTSTQAMRHVLTAALGSTGEQTDPQVQRFHLNDGDQLLLCTDGLCEMVADDNIAAVLMNARSSEVACQQLVDLANITIVLARYRFPKAD